MSCPDGERTIKRQPRVVPVGWTFVGWGRGNLAARCAVEAIRTEAAGGAGADSRSLCLQPPLSIFMPKLHCETIQLRDNRLTAERYLVIFDCDGVLVDSEPTSNRVLTAR